MTNEMKRLLYCLDGWNTEVNNNNQGDANEWLRHLSRAYQDVDLLESIEKGCTCNKKVPTLRVPSDLWYEALFEPDSEENFILKRISKDVAKVLNGEKSFLILPSDEGFELEV